MGGIGHDFKVGGNWIHEPHLFATFNGGATPQLTLNSDSLTSTVRQVLFNGGAADVNIPLDMYAFYVQDDWRASSKLTLNLGLRWDVYPPWLEVDDRQSNFDETTGQFVVASSDASIDGVHVGRRLQTYSKGDVGPRLGFAYDFKGDGRTVVRGGFGVFWNFTPGGTSSSKAQNQPFLQ